MNQQPDGNLNTFVVEANRQLASVREMSWKSLSRSFNDVGRSVAATQYQLDAIRDGKIEDLEGEEATLIAVANALGYYQAALGKQMLERFPSRMAGCAMQRVSGSVQSSPPRAWCNEDERWIPANVGVIAKLDQQKAQIDEFISSLTSHEHGELMRVGVSIFDRTSKLFDSPEAEMSTVIVLHMHERNELDDLCCLLKIACVRLNDEFEKRWPDSIP